MTHQKRYLSLLVLLVSSALSVSSPAAAQGNTNRALMERLDRLERQINSGGNVSADADANPAIMRGAHDSQDVISLQEELRSLRGQLEKVEFENRNLKDKLDRVEKDVDFRLNTLEKTSTPADATPAPTVTPAPVVEKTPAKVEPETTKKPVNQKPVMTPAAVESEVIDTETEAVPTKEPISKKTPAADAVKKPTTAGDGTLSSSPSISDQPREHYNQAFRLLNQTRYEEASDAFQIFVDKYPDDPLIGNAYYWLGETHYIQRDYVKAADSFREGFEVLPNGPKAPDNLLKLAMTLRALNRNDDACTVLSQIKVKFKGSSTTLLDKAEQERTRIGCK